MASHVKRGVVMVVTQDPLDLVNKVLIAEEFVSISNVHVTRQYWSS